MSQRFIGSVIVGGNLTQVDGDEVYGYKKAGLNAGLAVSVALNKNQSWFLTVEMLFSQKGSHKANYADTMYMKDPNTVNVINWNVRYNRRVKYDLRLNYVEIPVVFHYEDLKTGFAIGAGLCWGRLIYVKEIESGYRLTTDLDSRTFSKNEWSAIGDVKFKLYKNLKLNFRFQYTFVPIRSRDYYSKDGKKNETRQQYNNVLTLRLIYTFNEKYKLNDHYDKKGKRIGTKWIREVK
jgi:hypothetical protein